MHATPQRRLAELRLRRGEARVLARSEGRDEKRGGGAAVARIAFGRRIVHTKG
jgi:hypothetical protein